MKTFKCPNCKAAREYEKEIIAVQCPCGYPMEELQIKIEDEDDTRNII